MTRTLKGAVAGKTLYTWVKTSYSEAKDVESRNCSVYGEYEKYNFPYGDTIVVATLFRQGRMARKYAEEGRLNGKESNLRKQARGRCKETRTSEVLESRLRFRFDSKQKR